MNELPPGRRDAYPGTVVPAANAQHSPSYDSNRHLTNTIIRAEERQLSTLFHLLIPDYR
jgi:hypothetical protein